MSDKKTDKYILPNEENLTVSVRSVDKLLTAGRGELALLYLYVLRRKGEITTAEAAGDLAMPENEVVAALASLGKLGLVRYQGEMRLQEDRLPSYTAAELAQELKKGEFEALLHQVQQALGSKLSSVDVEKLLGIRRELGMPPEVILMLVHYCVDLNVRRYGPGKRPTMRYIEKVAFSWEREGILSVQQAEDYLRAEERRRETTQQIKTVLQIRDRDLSASEQKYVDDWIGRGYSPELIAAAYDRTLIRTGRRAWAYMNSVLQGWESEGKKSPGDLKQADRVGQSASPAGTAAADGEVESMLRFLEELKATPE